MIPATDARHPRALAVGPLRRNEPERTFHDGTYARASTAETRARYDGPEPLSPDEVRANRGRLAVWDAEGHWAECTVDLAMTARPEYLLHWVSMLSANAADRHEVDIAGARWALAAAVEPVTFAEWKANQDAIFAAACPWYVPRSGDDATCVVCRDDDTACPDALGTTDRR